MLYTTTTNKMFFISGSTIGEEYRNRKGYFSINVQAVCDAELKLLNVVARWPGSAHDATIFNNSVLRGKIELISLSNNIKNNMNFCCI